MLSLVIPVYCNEESVPDLVRRLADLASALPDGLEPVVVIDGSPDRSAELLTAALGQLTLRSKVILLSRNFGSFAAIRAGLAHGEGDRFAIMSADLQEPADLFLEIDRRLRGGDVDVVVGMRESRSDPPLQGVASRLFWAFYRRFVQPETPPGGVDVFGCTRRFRDELLRLAESNTTLVGLVMWLGYRRAEIPYVRAARRHGRSQWTLRRRLRYLKDSIFAFSDLPLRLLTLLGAMGLATSVGLGLAVLLAKWRGEIDVPGYAATVLVVMFFGGLNCLGVGLLGEYVWRAFENSKGRPQFAVEASFEVGRKGLRDEL